MLTENMEYMKVAAAVTKIKVGSPKYNIKEIISAVKKVYEENKVRVVVFPELSVTGYTCGDLFNQKMLINGAEKALGELIEATREDNILIAVGMPVKADNQLFNCAVVLHQGKILGVVPKTFMPNYNEFYEKRWFSSSVNRVSNKVMLCGQEAPFNENLLFRDSKSSLCIGIDVCEDLWVSIPPSCYHTMYGANLILNLSASNEIVAKSEYRRDLVKVQSAKCMTGYIYASAGQMESTTDVVFSGHSLIAENGSVINECKFEESKIITADIDIEKLNNDRIKFNSYMGRVEKKDYELVSFSLGYSTETELERFIDAKPFVPSDKSARTKRCKEIFEIQSTGLYQKLNKIPYKNAVIGISGGLDSTLALLVTVEAFKKLKVSLDHIIAVTMPGFGTTDRTYNNALTLMRELGVTIKEVSIKDACIQHFKDIEQDINKHDLTYENSQARERTQILMDIAGKENSIVVGTGDLSELALGWCTYNGDHMSMYGVNSSIPKTLVKYLVEWYSDVTTNKAVADTLKDICDTPVSPELLPPDENGNILQVTEDTVGPYELHDFFLYNMLRNGYEPKKILYLASLAFEGKYEKETILRWLKTFYRRFFTQQFKRNCIPDGVKVGSICLSPRGDWRMPSEASYELWMEQLEE